MDYNEMDFGECYTIIDIYYIQDKINDLYIKAKDFFNISIEKNISALPSGCYHVGKGLLCSP